MSEAAGSILDALVHCDGAPCAVTRRECRVACEQEADGPAGVVVLASLDLADGSSLVLRLPPQQLGLGFGNPDDVAKAGLVCIHAGSGKFEVARVERCVLAPLHPNRIATQVDGVLADGRRFACALAGHPTLVQASVPLAAGRSAADSLIARIIDRDLPGDSQERSDGDTLTVTWQPLSMLAQEEAARQAARDAEAVAPIAAPLPGAMPEPSAATPLVAERSACAVGRAELSLHLCCDRQEDADAPLGNLQLVVGFEAVPVDAEGGDGELCPTCSIALTGLPIELPLSGDWLRLDGRSGASEGWFGNDAPELTGHRFAFRFLGPDEVEVDWSASYDSWTTRASETLRFQGRARLAGFTVETPRTGQAGEALRLALGEATRARLQIGETTTRSHGRWDVAVTTLTIR